MKNKSHQIVRGYEELWKKPVTNFEPKEENLPEEQPENPEPGSE